MALGMGMSTVASSDLTMRNVQAAAMMDEMAAVSCQVASKSEPCPSNMPCASICVGPALSVPPSDGLLQLAASGRDFFVHEAKPLVGRGSPPELSPPRTTYIA